MSNKHTYQAQIKWTGNLGSGTSEYTAYSRSHEILGAGGKIPIAASAAPVYRGEASRYNPEELLIAAIAGCHMLWYLHLCADAGVVVVAYEDAAEGFLVETDDGNGRFSTVTIRPRVTISDTSELKAAEALHVRAHELCFIANSMNFPVNVEPSVAIESKEEPADRANSENRL